MMQITAFEDVRQFQRRAEAVLAEREAEFNFMIGLLADMAARGWQATCGWPPLLATVEASNRMLGLAVRTPPHNLLVTDLPAEVMPLLAHWLRERDIGVPGVMGPEQSARSFATAWAGITGQRAGLRVALRTYRLTRVVPPAACHGQMRCATSEDFQLLMSWTAEFTRDIGLPPCDEAPAIRRRLDDGALWLWVADQQPVAMAASVQPTPHGIRISRVYTLPEFRGRGYATALVARLSQHQLDSGREFCFLFTDLANPTSNSIYRKIGYEGVCDYAEYRFE